MISLNELQKMLGFPETKTELGDETFFDEQETEMITSIINCLRNTPFISAEDARAIIRYNNVIKQVAFCLKKVAEESYQGKNEIKFYFNNLLPLSKQILMCLGYEVSDSPAKRISIKWWITSQTKAFN